MGFSPFEQLAVHETREKANISGMLNIFGTSIHFKFLYLIRLTPSVDGILGFFFYKSLFSLLLI